MNIYFEDINNIRNDEVYILIIKNKVLKDI